MSHVIRLYLWPHRLLLLGPGFDTGLHHHHAAQICFGLDGPLRLRVRDGEWHQHTGYYIPPNEPHELSADSAGTALLYIEAESEEFATFQRSPLGSVNARRLDVDPHLLVQFRSLLAAGGSGENADEACLAALGLAETRSRTGAAFDPRITKCLQIIRAKLDQPQRLSSLAAALNVSQSWLAHRFSREIGVPLRRYVLWQRLWRAVELALKGATLTEAAHAAGLSDSSHLSRAFRETFGIAPSILFEHRERLQVHVCSAAN